MKAINIFILFLISCFIASCGFHLRGNQDLSSDLPDVTLQGINHYSEFGRELVRALTAAKVNVDSDSSTALNISREAFSKRVISLDNAGRANQYELRHDVTFSLVKMVPAKDKQTKASLVDLIPAQTVSVKREYLFDVNAVLASEQEERRLKTDMIQASMLQIIRRLKFSLKSAKQTLKK